MRSKTVRFDIWRLPLPSYIGVMSDTNHIGIEYCRQKADECLELAKTAKKPEHRIMFEHLAETWERVAEDIEKWLIKK